MWHFIGNKLLIKSSLMGVKEKLDDLTFLLCAVQTCWCQMLQLHWLSTLQLRLRNRNRDLRDQRVLFCASYKCCYQHAWLWLCCPRSHPLCTSDHVSSLSDVHGRGTFKCTMLFLNLSQAEQDPSLLSVLDRLLHNWRTYMATDSYVILVLKSLIEACHNGKCY